MKKIILFTSSLLIASATFGQVFSDNFDSYSAGDFLVQSNPTDWDTWNGGGGGTDDVVISDAEAVSGTNSIYFESSLANGGPDDIILRFDQVYSSGNFTLEANFFVVQGKGGYFNLQQDHTPGNVWAIDCFMLDDGTLNFSNSGTNMLSSTFPTGQWFNLRMDIDLTSNQWEVFVDNVSQGTFSNPVNTIGILDLFPVNSDGNGQAGFYVDDISYDHTPASLPPLNGGITFVNQVEGLAGQSVDVDCKVRNLGTDPITSFDITYDYAGGTPVTENVSGINLASLDFEEYTFSSQVTLVAGSNNLNVTISNINGAGQDADASDDMKSAVINPVVPATGRIVVGEEGTGTWCQYCPRGAVFMDLMADKYDGFWAGIAVHNNDPMAVADYDAAFGSITNGYPSALVDRGTDIDPSEIENPFLSRVVVDPKAIITNGASFDASTRELKVSLSYEFQSTISGNYKVACVLTEDGITGTAGNYSQSNAYSGGGIGEMGGYESLPNPVPASQMVYDHVARKISPSFNGEGGLIPAGSSAGDETTVCYTFTLPASWDESNMHIVGMLIDPSGRIDNAGYSTIAEAETNGLASCDATASLTTQTLDNQFKLYPNPATEIAYVDIIDAQNENIVLKITDLMGKVIATREYQLNGTVQLPIQTSKFAKGTYVVNIQRGTSIQQKKLIIR